jgi:hypothetical protein
MLRDWLASRTPSPPPRLAARLAAAVPASGSSDSNDTPRSLLAAAAMILQETVNQPGNERNGTAALDLLAVDALVTYAVEAAAEDCETFAALTDEMILRLAAVTGADLGESA